MLFRSSSAVILSPPLALFVVMLSKAHLTSHSRMSGTRCILSPCLLNLYAEYNMKNAGLEEAQARIKIARRNINNLRYADDTTL